MQQFKEEGELMKAIINELMYDTTASTGIYAGGNVAIWKTENGAFFKTSSEGITPMTEDEVKEFLGINDPDAYIKEFGEVESA